MPFFYATPWLAQAGYAVTKRGVVSPVARIRTVRRRGAVPRGVSHTPSMTYVTPCGDGTTDRSGRVSLEDTTVIRWLLRIVVAQPEDSGRRGKGLLAWRQKRQQQHGDSHHRAPPVSDEP